MNTVIAATILTLIAFIKNLPYLSTFGFTATSNSCQIRPICSRCYQSRTDDIQNDGYSLNYCINNNHTNNHECVTVIEGPFHLSNINEYWGRCPLLVRKAFPLSTNKHAWPSWNDIVQLSCCSSPSMSSQDEDDGNYDARNWLESGESARFIQHIPGKLDSFTLDVGPFDIHELHRKMSSTKRKTKKAWTLLLNDVERYYPDLDVWMDKHFQNDFFLPRWRRDDAQISCTIINGTIGPHVDNYDVCLIQMSGQRLWRIMTHETMSHASERQFLIPNIPVSVLNLTTTTNESTEPYIDNEKWVELLLQPGDMLYLPPRYVHWGIGQSNDCMTLSVGARAPSASDLLIRVTEHLQLQPNPSSQQRYTDGFIDSTTHSGTDSIYDTDNVASMRTNHKIRQTKSPTLSKSVKESMKTLVRNMMDDVFNDDLTWDMIVGKLITDPLRYSDAFPVPYSEKYQQSTNDGPVWSGSVHEILQQFQLKLDDNTIHDRLSLRKVAGVSSATSQVAVANDIVDRIFVHGEMYEVYNTPIASTIFQYIDENVPIDGFMLRTNSTTEEHLNDSLLQVIEELIENGILQPCP